MAEKPGFEVPIRFSVKVAMKNSIFASHASVSLFHDFWNRSLSTRAPRSNSGCNFSQGVDLQGGSRMTFLLSDRSVDRPSF